MILTMEKTLMITISGQCASDKSTIAQTIKRRFKTLGIACEVNDIDEKDSESIYFQKLNGFCNDENFSVNINVVQLNKEPNATLVTLEPLEIINTLDLVKQESE